MEFNFYYNNLFQKQLNKFIAQIPRNSNKHCHENEVNIQYFMLTPRYNFLDIIPSESLPFFITSLYWTILVDQVCYAHFRQDYNKFRSKTRYPKFIGNCTAPSLFSSQCGHHQHPKKVLIAVNDYLDKGNREGLDREIFELNISRAHRELIEFNTVLLLSKKPMKDEVYSYFINYQDNVDHKGFWEKCMYYFDEEMSF